jgi:hypothetical protein
MRNGEANHERDFEYVLEPLDNADSWLNGERIDPHRCIHPTLQIRFRP